MDELKSRAEMEMRRADAERVAKLKAERKAKRIEELIGKRFDLDLSGSAPVAMTIKEITNEKVMVNYLNSTPDRTEEFIISDFEHLSGVKIN